MSTEVSGMIECRPGARLWGPDDEDSVWEAAIDLFLLNNGNAYDALACLFGIRNHCGFRSLAEGRGFPADASETLRAEYAAYGGSPHTWHNLDHLVRARRRRLERERPFRHPTPRQRRGERDSLGTGLERDVNARRTPRRGPGAARDLVPLIARLAAGRPEIPLRATGERACYGAHWHDLLRLRSGRPLRISLAALSVAVVTVPACWRAGAGDRMTLGDDIRSDLNKLVRMPWSTRDGRVVPDTEDIKLFSNDAVKLDAVYLYADLLGSTKLARDFRPETAGKVIRAVLRTASTIIKGYGGEIRSYDGDRVMAIFIEGAKNTMAAECALKINYAIQYIVEPALYAELPHLESAGFQVRMSMGIASGEAFITRAGVRGSSDLVSIGRAPNVAAKLSDLRKEPHYRIYITSDVYNCLLDASRFDNDGKDMWVSYSTEVGGEQMTVYRSSYYWGLA
ncbi:adenylate/guanylate cyclase domain-containing protein [Streptomyces sp. IBSNAI002]|uniref:adenylate/guanylate cyclase domain-containing protein n=1 Tax=Streptomyces sp. IBSNAI002 TaxID=3457500 RepID=UPI003FD398EB